MVHSGRRPGESNTREQILAAARSLFAERGYDKATVRGIAAKAGVNAALVHHFFSTKQALFVAAMELPMNPAELIPDIVAGPVDEIGHRLATAFLAQWAVPEQRAPFLAMLRSVTHNVQAATMLREFIEQAVFAEIAKLRGIPRVRVSAAAAQLFGVAILRYIVEVPSLVEATDEDIVTLVGPTIQRYLNP